MRVHSSSVLYLPLGVFCPLLYVLLKSDLCCPPLSELAVDVKLRICQAALPGLFILRCLSEWDKRHLVLSETWRKAVGRGSPRYSPHGSPGYSPHGSLGYSPMIIPKRDLDFPESLIHAGPNTEFRPLLPKQKNSLLKLWTTKVTS